eukprot:sb/3467354/
MWLRGYSRLKKVGLGNKSVLFLLARTCKEASRHPDYNRARTLAVVFLLFCSVHATWNETTSQAPDTVKIDSNGNATVRCAHANESPSFRIIYYDGSNNKVEAEYDYVKKDSFAVLLLSNEEVKSQINEMGRDGEAEVAKIYSVKGLNSSLFISTLKSPLAGREYYCEFTVDGISEEVKFDDMTINMKIILISSLLIACTCTSVYYRGSCRAPPVVKTDPTTGNLTFRIGAENRHGYGYITSGHCRKTNVRPFLTVPPSAVDLNITYIDDSGPTKIIENDHTQLHYRQAKAVSKRNTAPS